MNKPSQRWQAAGGYLLDLWRLSRAELSNPHSYLKFVHINSLRRKSGAEVLVETGTFRGVTAARCAGVFKQVYTIELEPGLAGEAAAFLKRWSNVEVICGDAVEALPKLFAENRSPGAVVFLDGHYSGAGTASTDMPEPALQELELLQPLAARIGAILIDDFRSFGTEGGFPKKSELIGAAERLFPEFSLAVQYDQLVLVRDA